MTEKAISGISDELAGLVRNVFKSSATSFAELAKAAGLDPACDFRNADLRAWNLRGIDVRGVDFSGADLRGTRFEESIKDETTVIKDAILDALNKSREAMEAKRLNAAAEHLALQVSSKVTFPFVFNGNVSQLTAQGYHSARADIEALALIHKTKDTGPPLLWIHSGCLIGDVFHSLSCECHDALHEGLRGILESGNGVVIYFPHTRRRGRSLVEIIDAFNPHTGDGYKPGGLTKIDYKLAAAILFDLDCHAVTLITNNLNKVKSLRREGRGLKVFHLSRMVKSAKKRTKRIKR